MTYLLGKSIVRAFSDTKMKNNRVLILRDLRLEEDRRIKFASEVFGDQKQAKWAKEKAWGKRKTFSTAYKIEIHKRSKNQNFLNHIKDRDSQKEQEGEHLSMWLRSLELEESSGLTLSFYI